MEVQGTTCISKLADQSIFERNQCLFSLSLTHKISILQLLLFYSCFSFLIYSLFVSSLILSRIWVDSIMFPSSILNNFCLARSFQKFDFSFNWSTALLCEAKAEACKSHLLWILTNWFFILCTSGVISTMWSFGVCIFTAFFLKAKSAILYVCLGYSVDKICGVILCRTSTFENYLTRTPQYAYFALVLARVWKLKIHEN